METLTRALIGGILLALTAAAPSVHAQTTLENKLKAAIVSKFPQFVEWPAAALEGRATVDVCVVPPDPFGADLEELVAGETLADRKVTVRHVDRDADLAGCHLLVVSGASGSRRPMLQRAGALPILTVGDDPKFLDEGGIIRLRLVGGRMRFDVNADAARRVGLRISSQLMQLAVTVRGAEP